MAAPSEEVKPARVLDRIDAHVEMRATCVAHDALAGRYEGAANAERPVRGRHETIAQLGDVGLQGTRHWVPKEHSGEGDGMTLYRPRRRRRSSLSLPNAIAPPRFAGGLAVDSSPTADNSSRPEFVGLDIRWTVAASRASLPARTRRQTSFLNAFEAVASRVCRVAELVE